MDKALVYDVGVHNGDDTAFYLSRGYRVVGVEADPLLANGLRARFADEISQGDFVLLNVGVSEHDGVADFWVSERTLWSSFDKALASRDGLKCHAVKIRTTTLGSLFHEFGIPFYCKIDVEGYDRICLQSLDRGSVPKFLSVEFNSEEDLHLLRDLGYSRFKIISQVTRSQPSPAMMSLACRLPYRLAEFLRQSDRKLRGVTAIDGWSFDGGSSGPFGEDTPGDWRSYDSTVELAQFLRDTDARREAKGLHEWFDVHAMHETPGERLADVQRAFAEARVHRAHAP
jgi:FkbM family methyltransferase